MHTDQLSDLKDGDGTAQGAGRTHQTKLSRADPVATVHRAVLASPPSAYTHASTAPVVFSGAVPFR